MKTRIEIQQRSAVSDPPSICRKRTASSGFTLLEMLAAVTITMILVLILSSVFNQTSRAWTRSGNQMETYANARVAIDCISRDVASSVVNGVYDFLGDSNNVAFVAADGTAFLQMNLSEVLYTYDPIDQTLSRWNTSFRSLGVPDPNDVLLANGYVQQPFCPLNPYREWNVQECKGWTATKAPDWAATMKSGGVLMDKVLLFRLEYFTNAPNAEESYPTNYWNSTASGISGWRGPGEDLPPSQSYMNDAGGAHAPAGIRITLRTIDDRSYERLTNNITDEATQSNLVNTAAREFVAFATIQNYRK